MSQVCFCVSFRSCCFDRAQTKRKQLKISVCYLLFRKSKTKELISLDPLIPFGLTFKHEWRLANPNLTSINYSIKVLFAMQNKGLVCFTRSFSVIPSHPSSLPLPPAPSTLTNFQPSASHIIRAVRQISPMHGRDETIPQTNVNPGPDPAACQEDERLRQEGRKKKTTAFHFQ